MSNKELKDCRQYKEMLKKSEQKRLDGKVNGYGWLYNVPLTWCVRFDLTTLELLTYCYIRDCTANMKEGAFTGSVKTLRARFNVSAPTQRRALERLEEKGFIWKEKAPRGDAEWVRYVDTLKLWHKKEDSRSIEEIIDVWAYKYEEKEKAKEEAKKRELQALALKEKKKMT